AFSEPHLQLSSPSGIAATTPANAVVAAGSTSTVTAGQDLNFAAQANANYQLKDGISLFTYGKASATGKPNQETGLRLHAASGRVSVQSQSDVTKVTADKLVTVASIGRSISISAKEHVMLTAQGAYLKLEGGNIMIHGPGTMVFKASMKELGGPASALPTLPGLPKAENIDNAVELNFHYEDLVPVAHAPYKITFADGTSRSGTLDAKGYALVSNVPPGDYHVEYGEEPVPWLPPALEPDPELERARASKERVAALIEEARRKQEKGTSA
ncbi:DUF2345 domain-containing protein, partial [Pseudoduganella plicata]